MLSRISRKVDCKADCAQEHDLFISTKHPHYTYPLYETNHTSFNDVSYLLINDILEYNPLYVQSGCDHLSPREEHFGINCSKSLPKIR